MIDVPPITQGESHARVCDPGLLTARPGLQTLSYNLIAHLRISHWRYDRMFTSARVAWRLRSERRTRRCKESRARRSNRAEDRRAQRHSCKGIASSGCSRCRPAAVDLAFADPPFNIGYEYDVYEDSKKRDDYLDWSKKWIGAVHRVLKPDGTFWLAIGDEYAAELKLASQEIGFTCRSWVIWYYTFGVNCTNKFSRSHAHLFYFVKDPKKFTFRADELENRVPSARQLVYADKRANPERAAAGRHLGAAAAGPGRMLHDRRRHLVLSARGRHVQGAGRLSRLPDARAIAGTDHPSLLAQGGDGARPVQRQHYDGGRGEEARPAVSGHRPVEGICQARSRSAGANRRRRSTGRRPQNQR